MPWDGTTHSASSERIRILPRSPRSRVSAVSATATPRLMNDCRETLNAHKEVFTRLPSFQSVELAIHGPCALVKALAAPLDQDDQHNHKRDCGDDSNQRYIVHLYSP